LDGLGGCSVMVIPGYTANKLQGFHRETYYYQASYTRG